MLKHSKGKIITTLKTCSTKVFEQKIIVPDQSSMQADKKKNKKGKNNKDLGPAFLPEAPCGGEGSATKQTNA